MQAPGIQPFSFAPVNDNGGGDGMDPWQTSVEKRLDSLDNRLGRVEGRLGQVEISLATLAERVKHLPGKEFVVYAAISTVTALTAIIILLSKLGIITGPVAP